MNRQQKLGRLRQRHKNLRVVGWVVMLSGVGLMISTIAMHSADRALVLALIGCGFIIFVVGSAILAFTPNRWVSLPPEKEKQ